MKKLTNDSKVDLNKLKVISEKPKEKPKEKSTSESVFLNTILKPYLIKHCIENVKTNSTQAIEHLKYDLLFKCLEANNFKVDNYGSAKEVQLRLPKGNVRLSDSSLYNIIKSMKDFKILVETKVLKGYVAYTSTIFWYFPITVDDSTNSRYKVLGSLKTEIGTEENLKK